MRSSGASLGPAPWGAGFLFSTLRLCAAIGLLALLMCWDGIAQRPLSAALGAAIVLLLSSGRWRPRRATAIVLVALWAAISASPYELALRDVPGPPRIVPVVTGNSRALIERDRRGEVYRAGTRPNRMQPRWVLVW